MWLISQKEKPDHFNQLRKLIICSRKSEHEWPVYVTVFVEAEKAEKEAACLSSSMVSSTVTVFDSSDTPYADYRNGERVVYSISDYW